MPRKVGTVGALKATLARERRTNRRMRALIDALTDHVRQNRRDLDLQFQRIASMQAQIDQLLKDRSR
jgi:hypothetical protein